MKFEAEGRVPNADLQQVYEIIRDRLPLLVPYMDNVSRIEELERGPGDAGPKVLNRWRADAGQVPGIARKFISPEMLEWLDRARWDDTGHHVDWEIEPSVFQGMYRCGGRNRIVQDGADVKIVISGDINVDPKKIPGLPSLLARKVLPVIEGYLIDRMKPNMASLGTGVARFLAAGGK